MCFSLAKLFGIRRSETTTLFWFLLISGTFFDTMDSNLLQTLLFHWFLCEVFVLIFLFGNSVCPCLREDTLSLVTTNFWLQFWGEGFQDLVVNVVSPESPLAYLKKPHVCFLTNKSLALPKPSLLSLFSGCRQYSIRRFCHSDLAFASLNASFSSLEEKRNLPILIMDIHVCLSLERQAN